MNKERINWDEYFLNIAKDVSKRSTCLRRNYGAVIVDKDHKIVATGYNGAARKEIDCLSKGICRREELNIPHGQNYELCVAVHAETNAIINCDPKYFDGTSTIYIYGSMADTEEMCDGTPCLMCDRMITNARLKRVYYMNGTLVGDGVSKEYKTEPRQVILLIGNEDDTILISAYEGSKIRKLYNLDNKDKDNLVYKIVLPSKLKVMTMSYFFGLFQDSVKKLGEYRFKRKYVFETNDSKLIEQIKIYIEQASKISLIDSKYLEEEGIDDD